MYLNKLFIKNSKNDYEKIDSDVRKLIVKHKIHLQPANTERLYLPRKELGRGLGNIVHKSEKIIQNLRFSSVSVSENFY